MHNSPEESARRWSTRPAVVLTGWLGALGALAWCTLGPDDPAGRLLIGVTAAALAAAALYATLARPRLAADHAGIRIGGLRGPHGFPWSSVRALTAVRIRRFGREVPTLEIETLDERGERLHVFSRLELGGADPSDVADVLTTLRAGH